MSDPYDVHQVTMWMCDLCLDGSGGECHTPGCTMYLNRAPDLALRDNPSVVIGTALSGRPVVRRYCVEINIYEEHKGEFDPEVALMPTLLVTHHIATDDEDFRWTATADDEPFTGASDCKHGAILDYLARRLGVARDQE